MSGKDSGNNRPESGLGVKYEITGSNGDKVKIRNKGPIITQPVRVVSRPNLEVDKKEEK